VVYDIAGREVMRWSKVLKAGENRLELDFAFPSGVYFVKFKSGKEERLCKFIYVR